MKIYIILMLFILGLVSSNAFSNETHGKYDLSSPDKAFDSFINASKSGDYIELKKMLAPRIKDMLSQGKFTIEQYAKAWSTYPIKEKSRAELFKLRNDTQQSASIDIVILVNGKEHKTHVLLTEISGIWLWNEK